VDKNKQGRAGGWGIKVRFRQKLADGALLTDTYTSQLRALGTALVLMAASACSITPWPHTVNLTPMLRGTIGNAGKPLANAPVRLATGAEDDPCARAISGTATDPDGAFTAGPVTELRLTVVAKAFGFFPWSLCYRDGAKWTVLSTRSEYALVDSGPTGLRAVRCDVSRAAGEKCEVREQ
jgi:hypothetical protein